jgi:hypothetical protein
MNCDDFLEHMDVFLGQTSDALCYVYAQFPAPSEGSGWQLRGTLRGPSCTISATLPATHSFVPQAPGGSLLARAVVPEPSFWTPEVPHVYQAEIRLMQGEREVACVDRLFGIRTLGAASGKLIYGGKRWVLRGVGYDEVLPAADWNTWHASDTAAMVDNPSDAQCEAASRAGVLLVAHLRTSESGHLARLSRWPAVGMVLLPGDAVVDASRRHNLILAQHDDALAATARWAQAVVVQIPGDDVASCAPLGGSATLALRRAGQLPGVSQGRIACDRLQRDLAGTGDWAGFIV